MSEMIERVARAIITAQAGPKDWSYEEVARAAIEAMRGQCSDAMLRAFWDTSSSPDFYPDDVSGSEWYGDARDFRKGFDAMIDAALKD